MVRSKTIPALEKAKQYASVICNPAIEAFRNAGGKVVGCFVPDTPVEILEAAGLMPFDMRGTGADGTEYADAYFRQLTCEFTRTTFNQIASGQYAFLDGAVLYNCCDHLRRIFDNWKTLPTISSTFRKSATGQPTPCSQRNSTSMSRRRKSAST